MVGLVGAATTNVPPVPLSKVAVMSAGLVESSILATMAAATGLSEMNEISRATEPLLPEPGSPELLSPEPTSPEPTSPELMTPEPL